MNDYFEKLNDQKKERILNAALAEFAQKKYDDASTNNIVSTAQIGKGMLFHYFGNKKNLYLYLYRYIRAMMDEEIYSKIDCHSGDLPTILKQLGELKLEVLKRHPDMTDFITQCIKETSLEVYNDIQEIRKERGTRLKESVLFDNLDMSLLKPEFRNTQSIRLIRWTLNGFILDIQKRYKGEKLEELPIDELMKEYDSYVDIIRKAFYL